MTEDKKRKSKVYTEVELLNEKVKLLDWILASLCSRELNQEGRTFINQLKIRFKNQADELNDT